MKCGELLKRSKFYKRKSSMLSLNKERRRSGTKQTLFVFINYFPIRDNNNNTNRNNTILLTRNH